MLLIYTPKLTNRIGYTIKVIFHKILRFDYLITTDIDKIKSHDGPRLAYCKERIDNIPFIYATQFLFETKIAEQEISAGEYNGHTTLFPTTNDSDIPYDPLAATFYMLSRYEEYLPHDSDIHNRYPAKESIAYKKGFLLDPVVDIWADDIIQIMRQHFCQYEMPTRQYKLVNTIDIDAAYKYKHKGLLRTLNGMMRDWTSEPDKTKVHQRLKVILNKESDPFDTFDYIISVRHQHPTMRLIFFALMGDYGTYDKSIPYTSTEFQRLLQHLYDYAKVGIHPSYESFNKPELVKTEIERLSEIMHRHIVRNRFHFLRMNLPDSYHTLIDCDIQHDYSMGYAEEPGYRAGTCTPYPFFDLTTNQEMPLTIHPFAAMDTTWIHYKRESINETKKIYQRLLDQTISLNGTMSFLWHNQYLCNDDSCKVWRELYEMTAQSTDNKTAQQ